MEVASAFVTLLPSARGFGAATSRQLSGEMDKAGRLGGEKFAGGMKSRLGGLSKGIVAPVAAAFAGIKVVDFFKGAVSEASDLAETQSKVGVVFGKSAGSVLDFGKNSATAMGISKNEALGAAATFGNLFVAMKLPQKQAAATSTEMVKLASDLASFNNVNPEDALDALRSGLIGEAEPLRKFGVQLSEGRVQAEALALGLVKPVKNMDDIKAASTRVELAVSAQAKAIKEHGKNSDEAQRAGLALKSAQDALTKATKGSVPPLTDQQKLMARQSIIMKDTKVAQGDFTRTSGGLANQQRILSAQWTDMKAKLGGALLPVITTFAKVTNSVLLPALLVVGKVIGRVAKVFKAVAGFVADNLEVFGLLAGAVLVLTARMIANTAATILWNAVGKSIVVLTKLWTAGQWLLNAALSANPIGIVVALLIALVAGLILAWKHSETFRNIVTTAFNAIKTVVMSVVNAVKDVIEKVFGVIERIIRTEVEIYKTVITTVFHAIKTVITTVINAVKAVIDRVLGVITALWKREWNGLKAVVSTVWDGIKTAVGSAVGWVKDKIDWLVEKFTGLGARIKRGLGNIVEIFKAPFKLAFDGIADLWNNTVGKLSFKAPGWVPHFGGKGWDVPDIPKMATGGTLLRGGTVLVGEKGPELLNLPRGAVVSPRIGDIRGSDGATAPTIIVNNPVPEPASQSVPMALREASFVHGYAW